jgi:SAM-dependent methyltransferase
MRRMERPTSNAEQITFWNEQAGPRWVERHTMLDAQIAPFGAAAMEALRVASGERVVDIGCGCGDTTLALARKVGPTGRVLGVDVSGPMLDRARERVAEAGLRNVELVQDDAQTHVFTPESADALFSRFGVMFFADPVAAFRNLRTALVPGGRLGFACWQALPDNPWMAVPLRAAAQHVQMPPPPAPDAPGPFAYADRTRLERILGAAGFATVDVRDFSPDLVVGGGGGLDVAVELMLNLGPMAALLRDADVARVASVAEAVREAIRPYATSAGVVMPSKAWIVTAT